MAWFTPPLRAGVNKLDTGLANEGGWADSNFVRWLQGAVQVTGGWLKHAAAAYTGKARGAKAWRTLEGAKVFAWGTESKLYAEVEGTRYDITPRLHQTVLSNPFTTVQSSPIVTVHLDFHLLNVGDVVVFPHQSDALGQTTPIFIGGTYTVTSVPTPNTFTITHTSSAPSTITIPAGGNVDFTAELPAGLASSAGGVELRDWSLDLWGEYLLANPSGGGLYEYQPEVTYSELVYNGDFAIAAGAGWAGGSGWSWGSARANKSAGTGSNLSQDFENVLEGGRYYEIIFTVVVNSGTIAFRINAGDPEAVIDVATASSPISKSGTYSRIFLCPADPKDIVFAADSAFAGNLDNISLKIVSRAYRVTTAPARIDAMFVDPRGLVIALGTNLIDGSYSSTAFRCSDLGNNRSWIPDSGSLATEKLLRGGGKLMQGVATRQQNLVGGDEGVFSLQYQGTMGDAFAINLLATGCGLPSRHSMAESNGFVFWVANTRKFFIMRGVGATSLGIPEEIPCPVRENVFDNLDWAQALKIHTGINSSFSEAWFFYPDARDGNECSRVAVCAWTQGGDAGVPWWQHQVARTSWIPPGTFNQPIAFGADSYIYDHETGYLADTVALNEYAETSPFDAGDGEYLMRIKRIIPDFKSVTGDIRIYVKTRPSPKGTMTTHGPFTATQLVEFLDMRIKARQMALRFEGASAGAFWRMLALRLDIAATTAKR